MIKVGDLIGDLLSVFEVVVDQLMVSLLEHLLFFLFLEIAPLLGLFSPAAKRHLLQLQPGWRLYASLHLQVELPASLGCIGVR